MLLSVVAAPTGFAAAVTPPSAGDSGESVAAVTDGDAAAAIANPDPSDIVYRVNAGGGTVSASDGDWTGDWQQYHAGSDATTTTSDSITVGPSAPDGTPESLFQSEVYGEQTWTFSDNVQSGQQYEVRLYFAETFHQTAGNRVFDVAVEGDQVLTDFDIYEEVGHDSGLMKAYRVTPSDGNITVDLLASTNNPKISAIEIVQTGPQANTLDSPLGADFGPMAVGNTETESVTVTNLGESGDPDITLDGATVSGNASFSTDFAGGVTLAPGESTDVPVEYSPEELGSASGTLSVNHSGSDSPTTVELAGEGVAPPVGFSKSTLQGFNATEPTALDFGPDGRLYVSTQGGTVYALEVERTAENSYQVTDEVTINGIKNIPNHNDTGDYNPGENNRQITGLTVGGTASQPVVYVSSSDPSIDVGQDDDDTDTNSGTISRLTISPGSDGVIQQSEIDHEVLVIGLPRSEENHATNGLELTDDGSTLYVAQGGNTNKGAPSNNFGQTPEYALSAAILSVDLDQIESFEAKNFENYDAQESNQSYPNLEFYYGIPTIQNDDDTDGDDLPFGGNDGINQAKIVENGPVQVYGPGFRNPYDLVLTESGQIYAADHGANGGWGGPAVDADGNLVATAENVTNHPNENASFEVQDALMKVDEGDYAGHPNPFRANPTNADIYNETGAVIYNITSANSPVPESAINPEEADYISPTTPPEDVDDPGAPAGSAEAMITDQNGDAVTFAPTGAIDEYTASNFAGTMEGDLIQVELYGEVKRVQLNADGTTVTDVSTIFNTNGPLGVAAQGDDEVFPGTIWTADHGDGGITAVEPNDYGGGSGDVCTGDDDASLDEDGDGYDNADELDAGTDPCSSASTPADFDDDGTSNLNDPDDDNDGSPDTEDPFAVDPDDGTTTSVPVTHDLSELSLFDQGWTGLMTNGSADYQSLYNVSSMTVGGAAEVLTVENVPTGTAVENDQQYAFQFGVNPPSEPFVVETTVNGLPENPEPSQAAGVYVGTGDQDNYVKLVSSATDGTGGVQFAKETNGNFQTIATETDSNVTGAGTNTDLYLVVDPTTDPNPNNGQDEVAVTAEYATDGVNRTEVATGAMPASWLDTSDGSGLAVGIISTSNGANETFTATWTDISVSSVEGPPIADAGTDQTVDEESMVTLDASGSTDPDDATLDYTWTQTAGSPDVLNATTGEQVSFTAPNVDNESAFTFEVTVADGDGNTDTDEVNVTVFDTDGSGDPATDGEVVYRVNAGGSQVDASDGGPAWSADTSANPSTYVNTGDTFSTSDSITLDGSVPNGTPTSLFQSERYDPPTGSEMQWSFGVEQGTTYEVRLYFAEIFITESNDAGPRVFDTAVEGETVLNDYDIYEQYGHDVGAMESVQVTPSDDTLNIAFAREQENPKVNAIEIVAVGNDTGDNGAPTIEPIADQTVTENESATVPVNASDPDGDTVSLSVSGPDFVTLSNSELTIAPQSGDAGTYAVDVTADDNNGSTTTESFQLTVETADSGGSGEVVAAINAGGSEYTASDGTVYQADTSSSGSTFSVDDAIAGTTDDELYQTERYGDPVTYVIPVSESGTYEVTLKFAEIYHGADGNPDGGVGDRVFGATVEGQQVLSDYDIYADVGALTATDTTTTVEVTDGTLNVALDPSTDNAKISAIKVVQTNTTSDNGAPTIEPIADQTVTENESTTVPVNATDPDGDAVSLSVSGPDFVTLSNSELAVAPQSGDAGTYAVDVTASDGNGGTTTESFQLTVETADSGGSGEVVAAINAGGSEYTASDGTVYQADTSSSGSTFSVDDAIAGTTDDQLYQTERYGTSFGYDIPVSESGTYEVTLKFAEIYHGASGNPDGGVGDRVFGATVEGQQVLSDYDIYADVGALTATDTTTTVEVTDGTLNVDLSSSADNAKISAIKVVQSNTTSDNSAPTIEPIADQTVTENESTTVPVNASDPDGDTVSLSVSGPDFVTLSNSELTIAPQSGDEGTYTVDVTASDGNGGTTTESFQLTVGSSTVSESSFAVTAGAGIDASTYGSGTIEITNTGDTQITSVTYDLGSSVFPDVVFDPNGTAGDSTAKGFVADSGSSVTGLEGGSFDAPHNGQDGDDGYDELTATFGDFESGETFAFSTDIDPTSIKGGAGSGAAGSVSGLELSGATVTVEYADGSTQTTALFGDGSVGGAEAAATANPANAPLLGVDGVSLDGNALDSYHGAATVGSADQTITLSGPEGATVELLHVEGQLQLANDADGYQIEPYEANTAENVDYQTVDLGSDGEATVDVTLTNTSASDAEGGFNYFVAAVQDGDGDTGLTSNVVVLKYEHSESSTTQGVFHRVNAGGGTVAAVDGGQNWTGVTGTGSQYLASASGNNYCTGDAVTPDGTVPASTPDAVFDCERYGTMTWEFPVEAGQQVDVRLFVANSYPGTSEPGEREFNVSVEGSQVLSNYDPVADVGHATGTMKTFTATDDGDGTVTVTFEQGAVDNPLVNAIEVVDANETAT
ncbi:ring canal kelch-like protein [Halogeometricum pallidum JCM 14848]|uniref:Ring canal kelch-like protein n=1 Tax=Halogeometricum pallidum JCM 14848 TaxID=1227487 RepID=M0CVX6_HALPD|nr:malectin domain-containing carbohydrate-binding protein [Halogeometricum pallidum]ELZ27370.1 ring canal kelch-like protein [Halogeometricum pallidum JCM 14848]